MLKIRLTRVSVLLFIITLLFSCRKQDSSIGLDIQPEGDLLGSSYCDTNTIISYTILDDSMRTDENSLSVNYAIIGTLNDPVFGRSDASVFTNFVMLNNVIGSGFGSAPKLDSVVLTLTYLSAYYGDTTDALRFNVYKIRDTDSLSYDSSYYSGRVKNYDPTDVTYNGQGIQIKPYPKKNVQVGDGISKAHVRLRLKDEIGQYFMDDTTRIASTAALQHAFRGLYITTRNTPSLSDYGSLIYFSMTDEQTRLTLYYHNSPSTTVKALDLGIGTSGARYNQFEHDYSTAFDSLRQQLAPIKDTARGQGNIFIQGLAGLKAKIQIPYLQHLADSGAISINKAELTFKVNGSPAFYDNTKFPTPPRLILDGINETGSQVPLAESADPFTYGGVFNTTTGEYVFNIPYTAQKIVSKTYNNYSFLLSIFQYQLYPVIIRQQNPGRVVICGSKHGAFPIKLRVWYTKLYKK